MQQAAKKHTVLWIVLAVVAGALAICMACGILAALSPSKTGDTPGEIAGAETAGASGSMRTPPPTKTPRPSPTPRPTQTPRPSPTPTMTIEEMKATAKKYIPYDSLARNTEQYVGQVVYYRGEIIQVMEGSATEYQLRVNVTEGDYGIWSDTVFVTYQGPRVLEDDIVDLWGIVEGRITYTAVLGNRITIPEIRALALQLVQ